MERVLFTPREALPPLPDVCEDADRYDAWVRRREVERGSGSVDAAGRPLHLVLLAGEGQLPLLSRTFASLSAQTSRRWSLTVVTPPALRPDVERCARSHLSRRSRRRTSVVAGHADERISQLLARGLAAAGGRDVALVFAGDVWAPDAVTRLRQDLTPSGMAYADEDRLTEQGDYRGPRLKPDYSPDLLLSSPYVGRPLAVGSDLVESLRGIEADTTADLEYECALRASEVARTVAHVGEVLCHRAANPHELAPSDAPVRAALGRRGLNGRVEPGALEGTFSVRYHPPRPPSVSILIPFRDEPRLLRTCVESVSGTAGERSVEFVLIDNGSREPETATLVERLAVRPHIRVISDDAPFNWARLNNAGARVARGDVLVFLNNDIEATRDGWLDALCTHAVRPDVGAVGARLLYPDRRLQHCGVVIGMGGAAGHVLAGISEHDPGYLGMATLTRDCAAVTGACLATRREVFASLDGFDESLGVDLNDVDYCLRAGRAGYRTVYEPLAELIHYESPSRGTAGGVDDIVAFVDRWSQYIARGDPYLNKNVTRLDQSCGLKQSGEELTWTQWHATLRDR